MKCLYIWDENLIHECDRLPAVLNRASLVHNLHCAYGLLGKLKILKTVPATYKDLKEFHSDLYLDHLQNIKNIDEDYETNTQDEEHGIGYDCPPVSNMFELISAIGGSSITAAKSLVFGLADIVINWCGGWHHANRFGAEGFCYVNDIVLAIEKLKMKFPKILYIDLDVHHGNGVQDAYSLSKSVYTLSLHKYEAGFYPGTGSIDDIGEYIGKGYTCNVPLQEGYCDDLFEYAFENVFSLIYDHFVPDAIVVQCGADALAHDPNGGASLTPKGYCFCIKLVLDKQRPTMILGGGGYNHANAARLWTSITALIVGETLDNNIPDHDQWPSYGPDFTMSVQPTLAKDTNTREYIDKCIGTIKDTLENFLPIECSTTKKTKQSKEHEISTNLLPTETSYKRLKYNHKEIDPKTNYDSSNSTDVYTFID